MKKLIRYLFCVLLLINWSCRKFVEIDPAPDLIQTNSIFTSDKTALAAVSGVYTNFQTTTAAFTNGGLGVYGGLLADEIYATASTANTEPFYQNQLLPTTGIVNSGFYSKGYRLLYQVNAILEGLEQATALTDSVRKQLQGEMLIVRPMIYFYLSNLFGEVPLVLTTDYRVNAVMPRSSIDVIQQQMIADLLRAQQLLTINYPSPGKVRPNQFTVQALLARVYVYQQNWSAAIEQATDIISSGLYTLRPNGALNSVFLKGSSETIFEVASPSETSPVGDAVSFMPASTTVRPVYALTSYLLGAFEPGDQRKLSSNWVGKNTVSGTEYFYPAKYRQRSIATGVQPTEYQVVFRLAELYLIRAEARAMLHFPDLARADLNMIRQRAGLSASTAVTEAELLTAIAAEKRIEFFCEWGHRWLDLKRTGKADVVLGPIKGSNWQTQDQLFPFPEIELNYNPFLFQNPGY